MSRETDAVDLNLKVWRQDGPDAAGRFETYEMRDVSAEMSFLELFDILNDAAQRRRATSRSRSTTTAVRASAAPAP